MKLSLNILIKTAMMIALGIVLPFAFHSIPNSGRVLLPMHIPVLLAGFLFGPVSGVLAGAITPLLSSMLTGMPPMAPVPVAIQMSVELAVFGLLAGVFYQALRQNIVVSLILTLLGGRLAYSLITLAMFPMFGLGTAPLSIVFGATLVTALPGLALQTVAIPAIVLGYKRISGNQGLPR